MVSYKGDLPGKQFSFIFSCATRALLFSDIENLIHAGVKSLCFKNSAYLINQFEDYFVNTGMQRAVTLAIQPIGIGPNVLFGHFYKGGLIKLRIYLQEIFTLLSPRLMAKKIDLGNDDYAALLHTSTILLTSCFDKAVLLRSSGWLSYW